MVLGAFTFVPYLPSKHWFVRGFDYLRYQITVLQIGVFVIGLFFISYSLSEAWTLLFLLFSIAYQFYKVLEYTPFHKLESPKATKEELKSPRFRLLTANVLMTNKRRKPLLDYINKNQPDVFLLMETNKEWEHLFDVCETIYKYSVKIPLENLYGMHLYSKMPLRNIQKMYLVEEDIPSIAVQVEYSPKHWLQLFCAHPKPPAPRENTTSKEKDAELLILANKIKEIKLPTILCGDLNDVSWSPATRLFRRISGLLDPRIGRGFFSTFHAKYKVLRFPLDHLFYSPEFRVGTIEKMPYYGSDHLAIYYDLIITSTDAAIDQEFADAEDHEEAEKIIQEGIDKANEVD